MKMTRLIFARMVDLVTASGGYLYGTDPDQPWLIAIGADFSQSPELVYADLTLQTAGMTPDVIKITPDQINHVFNDPVANERVWLMQPVDGVLLHQRTAGTPVEIYGFMLSTQTSVLLGTFKYPEPITLVTTGDGVPSPEISFRFPESMVS